MTRTETNGMQFLSHPESGMDDVDKFRMLGRMSRLWMQSPLHADWPVLLQAALLLPPLELGQYLLLKRKGMPVAFCTWAFLDQQAELAYLRDASTIAPHQWRSGDRLWIVDWIAPFGARDCLALKSRLRHLLAQHVGRALRVRPGRQEACVREFHGAGVLPEEAGRRLDLLAEESLSALAERGRH